MKKYLFLLFLPLLILCATPLFAKNICYLPETPMNSHGSIINETITKTLKINDYLVIFFFYDVSDPMLEDSYAKFNFENITKLAEHRWGKSNLDVDDYFDERGDVKPYVFVETGGTIRNGLYKPLDGIARISTCFDNQKNAKETELIYYFIASYYEDIVSSIDAVFTPLLALQSEKENKK
ncbi:MAG: hypothetical protein PF572_05440 [Patescibacteria group bacterium]|jgi:hypothetical protein|nr:hypothetical protein [Patescibacteria group bacterium]